MPLQQWAEAYLRFEKLQPQGVHTQQTTSRRGMSGATGKMVSMCLYSHQEGCALHTHLCATAGDPSSASGKNSSKVPNVFLVAQCWASGVQLLNSPTKARDCKEQTKQARGSVDDHTKQMPKLSAKDSATGPVRWWCQQLGLSCLELVMEGTAALARKSRSQHRRNTSRRGNSLLWQRK